jgi:putative heme-binding domain-containing protein
VRYFRAFDFHTDPSKESVLVSLLKAEGADRAAIATLALKQLHGAQPDSPDFRTSLDAALQSVLGTDEFLDLVIEYNIRDRSDELVAMAMSDPTGSRGVKAARFLLRSAEKERFQKPLADDATAEKAVSVLGLTQEPSAVDLLLRVVEDGKRPQAIRSAAVSALGRSRIGEKAILNLASKGQITVELQYAAAKALQASPDERIRKEAARYLKLPEPAGGAPLPPLHELVKRRGNIDHGKIVFNTTGTCAKCHTINGVGKDVGPNLSEIGGKFPKDALYESILFPSAAIAHNYETHRIELQNGNVVQGIIVSETSDSLTLKNAEAIVQTYKKSEIADNTEIKVSLMPADLQKLMTPDDLVDVVEYLTTCKKAEDQGSAANSASAK